MPRSTIHGRLRTKRIPYHKKFSLTTPRDDISRPVSYIYDRSSCPRGGSQQRNSSEVACQSRALLPFTYAPLLTGYGNEGLDPSQTHSDSLTFRASRSRFMNWCVSSYTCMHDSPTPRVWLGCCFSMKREAGYTTPPHLSQLHNTTYNTHSNPLCASTTTRLSWETG